MTRNKSNREEVLNVCLGQLLEQRGIVAIPETVHTQKGRRRMPDVLVYFNGLRLVIEGKIGSTPSQKKRVVADTAKKVEEGIAHLGVALLYPDNLKNAAVSTSLKRLMGTVTYNFAVIADDVDRKFFEGNIDEIAEVLRISYETLIKEDTLNRAVGLIQQSLDDFTDDLTSSIGSLSRLQHTLEIHEVDILMQDNHDHDEDHDNGSSRMEQGDTTIAIAKITGMTILNAMIFQEVLSSHNQKVQTLNKLFEEGQPIKTLVKHWEYIIDKINYYPIFSIARKVLLDLSSDSLIVDGLHHLKECALKIVTMKAVLRHDLMGRVFHILLSIAKPLGAYYTSIPSATLLAKLSLDPKNWSHRNNLFSLSTSKPSELQDFHVGDLACGSGTLLMTSADGIADNYIKDCTMRGSLPNLRHLHKTLLENVLWGFDVITSALHLTGSSLILREPSATIEHIHLQKMAMGIEGKTPLLGSIDLLDVRDITVPDLFGAHLKTEAVTPSKTISGAHVQILPMDLLIMNPPFTRSVGGNLLFGSLKEETRKKLQSQLKQKIKTKDANITAGLGSVFVAVGDEHLKNRGWIALVLPKALLSGVSWEKTRSLFNRRYYVEWIVVSHDPHHWNFSENTSLSECLIVAQKRGPFDEPQARTTKIVNLWVNQSHHFETLSIANTLIHQTEYPDMLTSSGSYELKNGETKYGEVVSIPWDMMQNTGWLYSGAFAQTDLLKTAFRLINNHELKIAGEGQHKRLKFVPLSNLCDLGFDRRDIHDSFTVGNSQSSYPAFWGHDSNEVISVNHSPNAYLCGRAKPAKGRPEPRVDHLWKSASRILIAERMRLNTQRVCTTRISRKVLSNVWWTVSFRHQCRTSDDEKIFCLWMNSTLGLLILLANRQETEGSWVDFKKPTLLQMPILDMTSLTERKRQLIVSVFDTLENQEIHPLPYLHEDDSRIAIDRCFAQVLGLPDLTPLRESLVREPIISSQRL